MKSGKKKVLVINLTRMGDIVQSVPLLAALKSGEEELHISYLAVTSYSEICRYIPQIDRLIPFDFNSSVAVSKEAIRYLPRRLNEIDEFIESLRKERFDEVINLSHTRISALICHLIGAPKTVGLTLDAEGYRCIRHPWARYFFTANLNRHYNRFNLVDINRGLASKRADILQEKRAESLPIPGEELTLQIPDEIRRQAKRLLRGWPDGTRPKIGFQPGASLACKRWPAESFVQLGRELITGINAHIAVFGSKSEQDLVLEVCEPLGERAINLAGKTALGELASLLADMDLLITNDTGTQHIAAAVGTPVLSLCFGSALSHETGPYGSDHVVMESSLSCYPCSFHVDCSRFRCQEAVTPEVVFHVAKIMLAGLPQAEISFDESVPSAPINLWRTDFDADGFWQLRPLLKRFLEGSDYLNLCSRELWKRVLLSEEESGFLKGPVEPGVLMTYLQDYLPPVSERFQKDLKEPCRALRRLGELTQAGVKYCLKLQEAFSGPGDNPAGIKILSSEIDEIDKEITVTGFRLPPVNHLVLDFNFLKQNLPDGEIGELIDRTRQLYGRLDQIAQSFRESLENGEDLFRALGVPDETMFDRNGRVVLDEMQENLAAV
jgi:lipopolysaccharide heptosyltransferase II